MYFSTVPWYCSLSLGLVLNFFLRWCRRTSAHFRLSVSSAGSDFHGMFNWYFPWFMWQVLSMMSSAFWSSCDIASLFSWGKSWKSNSHWRLRWSCKVSIEVQFTWNVVSFLVLYGPTTVQPNTVRRAVGSPGCPLFSSRVHAASDTLLPIIIPTCLDSILGKLTFCRCAYLAKSSSPSMDVRSIGISPTVTASAWTCISPSRLDSLSFVLYCSPTRWSVVIVFIEYEMGDPRKLSESKISLRIRDTSLPVSIRAYVSTSQLLPFTMTGTTGMETLAVEVCLLVVVYVLTSTGSWFSCGVVSGCASLWSAVPRVSSCNMTWCLLPHVSHVAWQSLE